MRIGTFVEHDGGYAGRLQTATLDIELALVPAVPADNEKAPDYRVMAGTDDRAREVGAGWKHVGKKAGDYVSLQIDDPAFPRSLRANLFKADGDQHVLIWSRAARGKTAT